MLALWSQLLSPLFSGQVAALFHGVPPPPARYVGSVVPSFNLFEVGGEELGEGAWKRNARSSFLLQSQGPAQARILASTKKASRPSIDCRGSGPLPLPIEEWLSPEFGKLHLHEPVKSVGSASASKWPLSQAYSAVRERFPEKRRKRWSRCVHTLEIA